MKNKQLWQRKLQVQNLIQLIWLVNLLIDQKQKDPEFILKRKIQALKAQRTIENLIEVKEDNVFLIRSHRFIYKLMKKFLYSLGSK